jgi:hypothetical protein
MKALVALWLTAIATLVWLAIPRPSTFEKRWPIALPPAMSLQTFNAARKASGRPSFCTYHHPRAHFGADCRWS